MATDLYEISGLCVDVEYMVMGVLANNVYIVSDGEGTMVVDPSCSADKILAALGERKLDAIVLTHSHFDHTGAAARPRVRPSLRRPLTRRLSRNPATRISPPGACPARSTAPWPTAMLWKWGT